MKKKAIATIAIVIVGVFVLVPIIPTYHRGGSTSQFSYSCILGPAYVLVLETPFYFLTGIGLQVNPNSCSISFDLF